MLPSQRRRNRAARKARRTPKPKPSLRWKKQALVDFAFTLGIEVPADHTKAKILAAIELTPAK